MPALNKSTLALTFKFDCDRFLRFRLATPEEKVRLNLKEDIKYRPGIDLIKYAGRRWEADRYQDLIDIAGRNQVRFKQSDEIDQDIGRTKFDAVKDVFAVLGESSPPVAIVEGEFPVPDSITPALRKAYEQFNLSKVVARPDILWLRKFPTGAPLIGNATDSPEYEIHVIDVKMAAEPTLRHFTEVTYYALALAEALKVDKDLSSRYAVSAKGLIWPGSHDTNAFRNLCNELVSRQSPDPLSEALNKTLIAVPYEVYEVHVKQFFEERLLRVLGQPAEEAEWHVGPKCQLCEFLPHCQKEAADSDHLSRVAWLTHGQAKLLRKHGIRKTKELSSAIQQTTPAWKAALNESHQLRAEASALLARTEALSNNRPEIVSGRLSALMPAWSNLNIYLTIHFDMGSGITFAMGAMRVFFPRGAAKGQPPQKHWQPFIVDRVTDMNTDSERARLIEFIDLVSEWLEEASEHNKSVPKEERMSAHIFFWDALEIKQLGRMLRRHIVDPVVAEKTELLMRFFPPDDALPDPDIFRSQPGTVVKEVFRTIVGVPVAHDYTLFDVASVFFPFKKKDGEYYKFDVPYGFKTPMTDQIPFERAYELWRDRIYLKHFNPKYPKDRSKWRTYTRNEIHDGIVDALAERLRALEHVVGQLRENYGQSLVLRKSAFKAVRPKQTKIPERARNLVAFAKLNAAVDEIKNRQARSLPVEEREVRFISIRGLMSARGDAYTESIASIRQSQARFSSRVLLPMTFSPDSRDCRIKEGDFLLALSNEDSQFDLDIPWHHNLPITFEQARSLLVESGFDGDDYLLKAPLSKLLQVELVKLESAANPPFLVLSLSSPNVFNFARDMGLLDLNRPMVLDPIFQDFKSKRISKALTLIGGEYPKLKMRRNK